MGCGMNFTGRVSGVAAGCRGRGRTSPCRSPRTCAATASRSSAISASPCASARAVSALHAVVVSDLKFKAEGQVGVSGVPAARPRARRTPSANSRSAARRTRCSPHPRRSRRGLETKFKSQRAKYWDARVRYSNYLAANGPGIVPRPRPVRPGRDPSRRTFCSSSASARTNRATAA